MNNVFFISFKKNICNVSVHPHKNASDPEYELGVVRGWQMEDGHDILRPFYSISFISGKWAGD